MCMMPRWRKMVMQMHNPDTSLGHLPLVPTRRGQTFIKIQRAIIAFLVALLITIVSLFAFALPASAHSFTNTGHISGQLRDGTKRNAPVVGQSVTLQMAQGQTASDLKTVPTDSHGMFSFSGLNTDTTISNAIYN